MSLLRGRDVVTVIPKVREQDALGYTFVDGAPIRVENVTVQAYFGQSGAIDEYHDGTQVRSALKVFGRGRWPGGLNSVVRIETGVYTGAECDQDGEAVNFSRSPATAHYEVNLTMRAPDAR